MSGVALIAVCLCSLVLQARAIADCVRASAIYVHTLLVSTDCVDEARKELYSSMVLYCFMPLLV